MGGVGRAEEAAGAIIGTGGFGTRSCEGDDETCICGAHELMRWEAAGCPRAPHFGRGTEEEEAKLDGEEGDEWSDDDSSTI
jgi:hypothetical protein